MNIDLDKKMGIAIYQLRKICGMSQKELADEVGVSQSLISMTESGERNKRMNLETLQKIVSIYDRQFPGLRLSDLIRIAEDVGEIDDTLLRAEMYCKSVAPK